MQSEFGALDIPMETFYSQAFLHDKFVGDVPSGQRGKARRYGNSLIYFQRVLPRLFGYSLKGRICQWHHTLVEHVTANDVFISLNYGCVLDEAFRTARRLWRPETGYRFL